MSADAAPLPAAAPVARLEPRGHGRWPWVLPLAALLFAAFLGWQVWGRRGPTVTVRAAEGHGIRPGDALRFRGITVGEVRAVELAAGLEEVVLRIALDPAAESIARAGSHFWIVRPHVTLDGVSGLETIFGARYLEVLPGLPDGPRQDEFVALREPPLGGTLVEGALDIVLEASARHGVRPGAPVTYRGIQVGSILSVGLASDATRVELRARIQPDYAPLVRAGTCFWKTSGVDFGLALLGGLRLELDSLRALLVGGVAFATPEGAAEPVSTGQRFELHAKAREDWLAWTPHLPVGHALLPPGRVLPRPTRATTSWRSGLFRSRRRVEAWVLFTSPGIVAPEELLVPEDPGRETVLEALGLRWPLEGEPARRAAGLALRELQVEEADPWPLEETRVLSEPEDCLLVGDPAAEPLPIDEAWLERAGDGWVVDSAVPLDESWHGASVVARSDGKLVGMLLVRGHAARIAPLP